jgi:hypothetical protein
MKFPSSMKNGRITLPNVGASFKKLGCYAPIRPKCQPIKIKQKKNEKK